MFLSHDSNKQYKEKAEWEIIKLKKIFDKYIKENPNGNYIKQAKVLRDLDTGIFVDKRDNSTYKWVKISNKIWMGENLNFKSKTSLSYDKIEENSTIYGRLYSSEDACKVCPKGWHLPSNEEWQSMIDSVGSIFTTGKQLKSTNGWRRYHRWKFKGMNFDIKYWEMVDDNGDDLFQFSALPGGQMYWCCGDLKNNITFEGKNVIAAWWGATITKDSTLYGQWYINDRSNIKGKINKGFDLNGRYSVRCVKNK